MYKNFNLIKAAHNCNYKICILNKIQHIYIFTTFLNLFKQKLNIRTFQ